MEKFNTRLASFLASVLCNMYFFYFCCILDIVALIFQPPHDVMGWTSFVSQTCIQLLALSVLAFVSKIEGDRQSRLLQDTHDISMEELKYLRRQHDKQWENVRKIHHRILIEHLIKLMTSLAIKLNYVDIAKNLMYCKKSNKDVTPIAENLIKELNYLDSLEDNKHKESFIAYYEEIKEEIKEIRVIFVPQILQHTDKQELLELLSQLDLLIIKFEDDITRCRFKENSSVDMLRFIQLIECASKVISELV